MAHTPTAHVWMQTCAQGLYREHRAKEQPCPGCSAVCTPALSSRAALSACLRTPPPTAPPSVLAAGHVQKVSERDQLYGEPDKPHHKHSRLALLSTFSLCLQNSYSILQNTLQSSMKPFNDCMKHPLITLNL